VEYGAAVECGYSSPETLAAKIGLQRPYMYLPEDCQVINPLKLIDEARRENGRDNVERAEALLSLAIQQADQMPVQTRDYSSAQGIFAMWRFYQNRFAEAEVFERRHIEVEKRLGIDRRPLANLTMWLAEMQQKQGKLSVAKRTIEEAIQIYHPEDLFELSNAYAQLGSVLKEMGDSVGASSAAKKSEESKKRWDEIVEQRRSTS
jgi:tetratricopeptide (TPR) repeat protein